MDTNADCVVVVPMFNEATTIQQVVTDLRASFARVLCVDDGSSDNCGALARGAGAHVVRHPVNLGQGAALQTGLEFARRDPAVQFVVTFDADGQHRVADAAAMLERCRRDRVDVILGSRFLGAPVEQIPRARRAILRAAVAFTRLTSGMSLTDTHNGLRVLNRRAVLSVTITMSGMAHASEILNQIGAAGLDYVEHPVTIDYTDYSRAKGQRNINAINIVFDVLAQRLRGPA